MRRAQIRRALLLEYGTVAWNVVEGVVATSAAIAAGSVALLGFGVDSFVETASAGILIWRLRAETTSNPPSSIAALDRRAHRWVAMSLVLLAGYVSVDATHALWAGEQPAVSWIGVAVTAISAGVMMLLARAKRRAAAALESRALAADAFQTTACWWLSIVTLLGLGLNGLCGWWWADPVAALGVAYFLVQEAREAWEGQDCC